MAKEILSATIDEIVMNNVRDEMERENRPSQSNMVEILLKEALNARIHTRKKKQTKK